MKGEKPTTKEKPAPKGGASPRGRPVNNNTNRSRSGSKKRTAVSPGAKGLAPKGKPVAAKGVKALSPKGAAIVKFDYNPADIDKVDVSSFN